MDVGTSLYDIMLGFVWIILEWSWRKASTWAFVMCGARVLEVFISTDELRTVGVVIMLSRRLLEGLGRPYKTLRRTSMWWRLVVRI